MKKEFYEKYDAVFEIILKCLPIFVNPITFLTILCGAFCGILLLWLIPTIICGGFLLFFSIFATIRPGTGNGEESEGDYI